MTYVAKQFDTEQIILPKTWMAGIYLAVETENGELLVKPIIVEDNEDFFIPVKENTKIFDKGF